MDCQNKVLETFNKRASCYESQTNWVTSKLCVEPFLRPVFGNGRAFEACAGTGAISKALSTQNWKVISFDLNREMLEKSNVDFPIIGDIHNIPTVDNHFDLVVCRQGLQYTDISVALNELYRICCGKIILGHITVEENDTSDFWQKYFSIASPGRKHIFAPNQIENICKNHGFKIVGKKTFRQKDNYNGPILHLGEHEINALIELILTQNVEFHQLYSVDKSNPNAITYTNRWEIIEIEV